MENKDLEIFARTTARLVKEYMSSREHRLEYEQWLKEYRNNGGTKDESLEMA